MTRRHYYQDAYKTRFQATIRERTVHEGKTAVVLDGTYFYPASGGQPADTGTLGGRPVVDVFIREDGDIVHVVEGELPEDDVYGVIDWTRRFDHMQQHTGQHILSQAFNRVAGAETISFHLSDNSITIDLDAAQLSPGQLEEAEQLANTIVWDDRPLEVHMLSIADAEKRALRKLPPVNGDTVRLVDITSFDVTACGGTHVARTGEVGLIKILHVERQRGHVRVAFLCGQRALLDYRQKNDIVNHLSTTLTTANDQVTTSIDNLRDELQALRRELRHQEKQLLDYEAAALLQEAETHGSVRLVRRAFSARDPGQLRALASRLAADDQTVVLFGSSGERSQLIFARAAAAGGQMDQLLRQVLPLLGDAGGGGSPTFAQGGGPAASPDRVERVLAEAERLLRAQHAR